MTPEGKIKKSVTDMLKRHGVWYFYPAANGMGRAGIPDLICCVNGKFLAIECKSNPKAKPTALQMMCGREITEVGKGTWLVVNDTETLREAELIVIKMNAEVKYEKLCNI